MLQRDHKGSTKGHSVGPTPFQRAQASSRVSSAPGCGGSRRDKDRGSSKPERGLIVVIKSSLGAGREAMLLMITSRWFAKRREVESRREKG